MITKFEKRGIAWLLTIIICLSMSIYSGMAVYAEDENPADATENDIESEDTEETTFTAEEPVLDEDIKGQEEAASEVAELAENETEKEQPASRETDSSGDYEFQVLAEGTVEITKYLGAGGAVIIPDTIEGKSVSSIGEEAFAWNRDVTQVSLPITVTVLQYRAFVGCTNLAKVAVPADSQLKTIGKQAFYTSGLTEMNWPSVEEIGESAFLSCSQLKSATLGERLHFLGAEAFRSSAIEKVNIPESLSSIEDMTFWACTELKEMILPDSITNIGENAFGGCQKLNTVHIGNKLAYISDSAFRECGLTKVTIGNQVQEVGRYAFYQNKELTEIDLPQNVTALEYASFRNCESLGKIIFPDSLEKIGGSALAKTAWYEAQDDGIVYAGRVLYKYKGNMPAGTITDVKEGTKGIAAFAFDGYQNLKEIHIPNGVTNIGDFAFYDCGNMTSVIIPASTTQIGDMALGYKASENGTAFESEWIVSYGIDGKYEKIPDFAIYGIEGSEAQAYAQENGFKFVSLMDLRIVPEVTDNTYVIGSPEGATITCTGELKDFVNVFMDGREVDKNNYTLAEGSTILTFTTKYLNTLSVGKHKVTLNYTYGAVDTDLYVLSSNGDLGDEKPGSEGSQTGENGIPGGTNTQVRQASPGTGDSFPVILLFLTTVCAAVIVAVMAVKYHLYRKSHYGKRI